ncbi:MAG: preprotein translocase subunit SecG [Clostridia bacterium]|nr:preprotein translocase subunit SecG [Clostridia bacterium]
MDIINMLMENTGSAFWTAWHGGIKQVAIVIMALCALFIILVVMFQPGNSSGISALGGTTETFLGKNKSKTFEHKMKVLTVISGIIFAVLAIVFAIIMHFA